MSTQIINQAKPDRYIVLLKDASTASINKAEKTLDKKLVSSQELSTQIRSQSIMKNSTGIVYKNLGVAVVDDISEDKLIELTKEPGNPVVYWEKEREYRPVSEWDQLAHIKQTVALLQEQITQLEATLKDGQNNDNSLEWETATWGIKAINLMKEGYTGKGVLHRLSGYGFLLRSSRF